MIVILDISQVLQLRTIQINQTRRKVVLVALPARSSGLLPEDSSSHHLLLPGMATIVPKNCARWRHFMFVGLLHKMYLIYYQTWYLQKMIFDIMFMLNLTYCLLNTFLKKMYFKLESGFYSNMVFYSLDIITIQRMMKHLHQICLLLASIRDWVETL